MSVPQTSASQDTTAIAMSEFDEKKEAGVTVTSCDGASRRPPTGRRKTTNELRAGAQTSSLDDDQQEDGLTKFGNILWKIHKTSLLTRYALYILPVALILSIPIIVVMTAYKNESHLRDGHGPLHEHIHLVGLFIWLEELWVLLWVSKLIAHYIPTIFQAVCGVVSAGIRKYTRVLVALEIPISLLIWTCAGFSASHVITIFDDDRICKSDEWRQTDLSSNPCEGWPKTVQKIFLAGIVVAAIFVAEKTIVQLIAINYHHKQYDQKIKEGKKMVRLLDMLYEESRSLFPEFCRGFEEEDEAIQGSSLESFRKTITKAGVRSKVLNDMGRARDKATAAFGAMVTDISGKKFFDSTSAHSIVSEALDSESGSKALARRLWLSFVSEGQDALYRHDLSEVLGPQRVEKAEEIFNALDRDDNGDVSLEEMTMLVLQISQARRDIATSIHDISEAIAVLDRLLCFVVLVAIAFVYAAFFSPTFEEKVTGLWTTFAGLAFAIGGTVTEFVSCCIFLFIKHPYDVGDRVDINDIQLIVEHVSLMYSVFRRVDSEKKVQIPHNVANALWVENVSRSKAMKERLTLSVDATTTTEDLAGLRHELEKFVTADENRRDFKPDLDIELISVGNLKQLDLCVEIRHKSNWANEAVRSRRRNKYMCELLAACRRIPIRPPGGSSPALGDPANPAYSVSVSDQEAINARAKKAADVEASRLFPTGSGAAGFFKEAVTTAFEKPAQMVRTSMVGRRSTLSSVQESMGMRPSGESMRISRDEEGRRRPGVSQGAYVQGPYR